MDADTTSIDELLLKHMLKGGVLFGYHMAKVGASVTLNRGESVTHTCTRGAEAWDMVRALITDAKWQELREDYRHGRIKGVD